MRPIHNIEIANHEYNQRVMLRSFSRASLAIVLTFSTINLGVIGLAPFARPVSALAAGVSAYDLILAMNTLRVSNGLPALVEDPIINAVAQATAETMAASQMSWHIGDVRGRLQAAGYGGGATVWATENFAVGNYGIDEIMVIWSDADHMIPAVNPAYCNVGAGVAKSANGKFYYILQAAYTSAHACGEYKSPAGSPSQTGGNPGAPGGGVSQLIVPVKIATPDKDGRVFHEVQAGQSFWSIAIAYKVTIQDLETWNNLSREAGLKVSQKLFIPGSNTEGYATPTPVGMVLVKQPGADGKIIHVVQPYQALSSIAVAYKVSIDTILSLNGIQKEWPLQIGQELLISTGGNSPDDTTHSLSPLARLTPASDGRYYHTVKSGETLSWIANLYEINLADLMAWNGLNGESILHPEQKLLLLVTPPATQTPSPSETPAPVALLENKTVSTVSPSITATPFPSPASPSRGAIDFPLLFMIGLGITGLIVFIIGMKRRS
ncbi:MAG: hypothetical protein B6D39_07740 [Anaerolineae bacterium UTCFX2]|nr:LysM peptidoglycan-binding domain-containing protein [Anaerolineae bacterium]OQY90855.1 MAG: hypothetical protein B6D39_07740 [Anaerolineae bacterium UTCFX2]